ncbi:hypothetical protein C0995_003129 [Termitomyces sp. Mi166|nr:hypothetical protein C0995_003129 [Termitomyces sp. Mi166\
MSTTIVFDQRPVFFFQPSYCIPVYFHILLAVLAMLLVWFGLTLAFVKPPVRDVPSIRPAMSLQSESTIVEDTLSKEVLGKCIMLTDIALTEEPESILPMPEELPLSTSVLPEDSGNFITLANPFSDVAAPVKVSSSPSLALYPFVRRMSTSRHPSFCIPAPVSQAVTSLRRHATVIRHGSLSDDAESYLPPPHVPSGKVRLIPDGDNKDEKAPRTSIPPVESKPITTNPPAPDTSKKLTKLKRVTKRVRALFRHSRQS